MVGAGLLLRTFWTLLQENPGFNPSGVVTAGLWLPVPNDPKADPYAKPEALNNFARESLRRPHPTYMSVGSHSLKVGTR
jgi:hypothetical protein